MISAPIRGRIVKATAWKDPMPRLVARLLSVLALCLLPALAAGQDYPGYGSIWVNDQADVLGEATEERITTALQRLAEETGVQATVLTLHTRWGYSGDSLEAFATRLFNAWGIGDAERNDGILVLVLTTDREMRIELGAGYPDGYNAVAQEIIDEVFLPAFGRSDFEGGIEAGVEAIATRIAREHAAGNPPQPVSSGSDTGDAARIGVFATLFALFAGWLAVGRRIVDRFRRCPTCGVRGVRTTRETLKPATRHSTGRGRRTVICPHCGHEHSTTYKISRVRSSSTSGGSFGGGSSSGGGASGRW